MKITIPGEPIPKGRPRMNTKTGTIYTPRSTKDYEDSVAIMAMATRERFGSDILRFTGTFYCSRSTRPDCDNLIKSVLDGLAKGKVFDNDKQVVEIHAVRIDKSSTPRTVIVLESLSPKEMKRHCVYCGSKAIGDPPSYFRTCRSHTSLIELDPYMVNVDPREEEE